MNRKHHPSAARSGARTASLCLMPVVAVAILSTTTSAHAWRDYHGCTEDAYWDPSLPPRIEVRWASTAPAQSVAFTAREKSIVRGAIASSIGHDSHNLIVVGDDDGDMARAINRLIELQGGCVAVAKGAVRAELPLPIAGLMSDRPFEEVASRLRELRSAARSMGSAMTEPFLQLAFLPLPVIPHLKLTDLGLVDVDRFELIAT